MDFGDEDHEQGKEDAHADLRNVSWVQTWPVGYSRPHRNPRLAGGWWTPCLRKCCRGKKLKLALEVMRGYMPMLIETVDGFAWRRHRGGMCGSVGGNDKTKHCLSTVYHGLVHCSSIGQRSQRAHALRGFAISISTARTTAQVPRCCCSIEAIACGSHTHNSQNKAASP